MKYKKPSVSDNLSKAYKRRHQWNDRMRRAAGSGWLARTSLQNWKEIGLYADNKQHTEAHIQGSISDSEAEDSGAAKRVKWQPRLHFWREFTAIFPVGG